MFYATVLGLDAAQRQRSALLAKGDEAVKASDYCTILKSTGSGMASGCIHEPVLSDACGPSIRWDRIMIYGTQTPCGKHVAASRDHHGARTAFLEHGAAGNTATVDHSARGKRQVFTELIPTGSPEGEGWEVRKEAQWESEDGVVLRLI